MTLLIVSDTHGKATRLEEVVLSAHADRLLFLGDGLRDLARVEDQITVFAVRGNCDWILSGDAPDVRMETFAGKRLLLMHGHRFGVKSGLDAAIAEAAAWGADVLLYGHTHERHEEWLQAGTKIGETVLEKPLLVLNPGSLGDPREGAPSFATLEIRPEGMLAGFGEL